MPVRCPLGGYAPCVDDMCHSGGTMLCGLEWGFDVCDHREYPDFCNECAAEEAAWYGEPIPSPNTPNVQSPQGDPARE